MARALVRLGFSLAVVSAQTLASPVPVVESSSPAVLSIPSVNPPGVSGASEGSAASFVGQIQSLQNEVLQLRGLVEEQANALRLMGQENRDRYLDLDRRIEALSTPGAVQRPSAAIGTDTPPLLTSGAAPQSEANLEQSAYQKAFGLIRERQFDQAVVALDDYLRQFPKGDYADNAQYWLGEVYLVQGKLEASKNAFQAVLKSNPDSGKQPDAMYKLGRIFDQLGDRAQSERYLKSVIREYSQSSAAKLADAYLRSLQGQTL